MGGGVSERVDGDVRVSERERRRLLGYRTLLILLVAARW